MKVVWSKEAKKSLDKYCGFIAEDSPIGSRKVRKEILFTARTLSENPYIYQIDEYYPDNKGDIRRFFRWHYRVVYQIQENRVLIINVYHTKKRTIMK